MVYGPFLSPPNFVLSLKSNRCIFSLSLQIKPNMHYFLLFSPKSYLCVVLWKICPGNIYLFEGMERGGRGGENIGYQVTKCTKAEKDFYVYFNLKDWGSTKWIKINNHNRLHGESNPAFIEWIVRFTTIALEIWLFSIGVYLQTCFAQSCCRKAELNVFKIEKWCYVVFYVICQIQFSGVQLWIVHVSLFLLMEDLLKACDDSTSISENLA